MGFGEVEVGGVGELGRLAGFGVFVGIRVRGWMVRGQDSCAVKGQGSDVLNGGMDRFDQVVSSCIPSFSTEKVKVPCYH